MLEMLIPLLERLMRIGAQRVIADIVTHGIVGLLLFIVGIIAAILWFKRRRLLPAKSRVKDWNGFEHDYDRWHDEQFCIFAFVAIACLGTGAFILLMQLNTYLAFDYETLRALRYLIR